MGRNADDKYDPAEDLTTDQAVADFIAAAFETNDPAYISHAREVAARAKAMHGLADLIAGTGNVYADLGHDDADEMLVKAQLATKIGEIIKARKWPQRKAAAVLGMTPVELAELLAGRFRSHSVENLEHLASSIEGSA